MGMVRTIQIIGECDKKGWTESKKENQQRKSTKNIKKDTDKGRGETRRSSRYRMVQVFQVCFIEYIIYQTTTLSHFPLRTVRFPSTHPSLSNTFPSRSTPSVNTTDFPFKHTNAAYHPFRFARFKHTTVPALIVAHSSSAIETDSFSLHRLSRLTFSKNPSICLIRGRSGWGRLARGMRG